MADPIRPIEPKPTALSSPVRRVGRRRKDDERSFEDALEGEAHDERSAPEPEREDSRHHQPRDGEPGSNLDLLG